MKGLVRYQRPADLINWDGLLDSFFEDTPVWRSRTPAVDVRETDEGYLMEAELPGLNEQDIELKVEDSGPGIDGEIIDSLFEPYVTTKKTGNGLGLAIVKKIAEEHGGLVWVENGKRAGARFVLRLPVMPSKVKVQ